jgi:hypothetical protein
MIANGRDSFLYYFGYVFFALSLSLCPFQLHLHGERERLGGDDDDRDDNEDENEDGNCLRIYIHNVIGNQGVDELVLVLVLNGRCQS